MEREISGVGMLVEFGERILLGERVDGQGWCFPGGKVELGETEQEAAIRETFEECNIDVSCNNVSYVGVNTISGYVYKGESRKLISTIFRTEITEDQLSNIKPQEGEIIQWMWASLEDLNNLHIFPPSKLALIDMGILEREDF